MENTEDAPPVLPFVIRFMRRVMRTREVLCQGEGFVHRFAQLRHGDAYHEDKPDGSTLALSPIDFGQDQIDGWH